MNIKINNYNKRLKKRDVLKNVNFEFNSGKIYGLHGRNGSGKTMLLRAISGLILPDSGEVVIDGQVIGKDIDFPQSVGIIIEHMTLADEYSAFKNLEMLAKIKKIATKDDITNALNAVGLDADSKQKVKTFSLGMKQKLNIAQAIMEKPKLLLLDEPTNALDDETMFSIRELLLKLKDDGTLIIIASHNKEELSALSDEIVEIKDGQIVDCNTNITSKP